MKYKATIHLTWDKSYYVIKPSIKLALKWLDKQTAKYQPSQVVDTTVIAMPQL